MKYLIVEPTGLVSWTQDRQEAKDYGVAFGPFEPNETESVEAKCRLLYDGQYAIGLVKDAQTQEDKMTALIAFNEWAKWPKVA